MQNINTDVVIIGAGPVGLFQVFELGLLGLSAVIIDTLPKAGGQCSYLYPHKPIYDIPALPNATGQSTIDNLISQCAPFKPVYMLSNTVTNLNKVAQHKFEITSDKNIQVSAKAVVIAAGNGAFEPVKLKVPQVENLVGSQVFYHVEDHLRFHDKRLVILGGGDSALDWVQTLLPIAESIVLIHRNERFRASPASVARMQQHCDQLDMQFLCGQVVELRNQKERLNSIVVQSHDGVRRIVEMDDLLVFFGLSPKPGPIARLGAGNAS